MLVSAAVSVTAVNDVDNFYNDYVTSDEEYDDANSYRGASGWLLSISSLAISFHSFMMFAHLVFYYIPSKKSVFKTYAVVVTFFMLLSSHS